ncbi:death-associated protein kinase 1-like isoform X2 [Neocloeon triangulifer]|uniref:death-associated protein kinase 1-like isoform X2 n=1 Tax=Neocloeon triangulifer TaxID=2078957 RepID=UPI00286EFD99|nr:death-associated protein kinase 1-like isoform X2 [Neocloeon triangulifer]
MQPRTDPLESYYDLGEEIGNGQSAVVRVAVEKSTGRTFAAKVVRRRRKGAGDERREAAVLASLRHPNVVGLHETFQQAQNFVLILELVAGSELEEVLAARGGGKLPETQSIDVVRQVLNGLHYMHSQGIAHLDLKPENVMVSGQDPPWLVKLIDFGLSREVSGGTERALQGTPEFLAPEAVNFEPLSLATDIWAVGVITYLLLTGFSPFLGEDKQSTFCNIVAGDFDLSQERFENVSNLAIQFISRVLVQDARKRPSALQCLDDPWLKSEVVMLKTIEQIDCQVSKTQKNVGRYWKILFHVISASRFMFATLPVKMSEEKFVQDKPEKGDGGQVVMIELVPTLICDLVVNCQSGCSGDLKPPLLVQIENKHEETELGASSSENDFSSSAVTSSDSEQCQSLDSVVKSQDVPIFKQESKAEETFVQKIVSVIASLKKKDSVTQEETDDEAMNTVITEVTEVSDQDQTPDLGSKENLEGILGGAELEASDSRGETPIFWAARQGNAEAVRLLSAAGAKIGAQNKLGETCLHVACRYGHASVVGALCLLPLDLDHRDMEGETALHAASARGHSECVRRLVDAGASLDIQDKRHKATPLMLAMRRHHSRVALLLLHAGADLETPDWVGDTPLHVAAYEGLLSVAQTLCAYGCKVDLPNEAGLMPLHVASRKGHTEIVRCLCLAGCDVERRNSDGIKAEITALKHGHQEAAELLARLSNARQRDEFIRQLVPGTHPISRLTIKLLGHCGVGKTTLLDTLGAGLLASFFRRSKTPTASISGPSSPNKTHIEMDVTVSTKPEELTFDTKGTVDGTRGVDVRNLSVAGVGEVSAWELSGQEAYLSSHHIFLTSPHTALHLVVCSLDDPPATRLQQCLFWLSFLKARIATLDPIKCGGAPRWPIRVILVLTHADSARCPKAQSGEYVSSEAQWLLSQLEPQAAPALALHPVPLVIDAHVAGSPGIRALKTIVNDSRQQLLQLVPRTSGLLDATLKWLQGWRRAHSGLPVAQWAGFVQLVRTNVNPLTGEEHLKELLHQLCYMGEALWLRESGLVFLCLQWLGNELLGQLLSPESMAAARVTGCYTPLDFNSAFPQPADPNLVLHVLESLDFCVQCENDGEIEYEFPCLNFMETIDGLWDPADPRYVDGVYCGHRMKVPAGTSPYLLATLFPRIQVQLRRATQGAADPDMDLYQWLHGSKLCSGLLESLVTLERGGHVEIKVRGPSHMKSNCFYFLEEIMAIFEQVILCVSPGLTMEHRVISAAQLRAHAAKPTNWPSEVVLEAALTSDNSPLQAQLTNPATNGQEIVLDILAFGASQVMNTLVLGCDLPFAFLGPSARQALSKALDPQDSLGRDWCLLAVSLGLGERLAAFEGASASTSPTLKLLDEWGRDKGATIGALVKKLKELGREDVSQQLLKLAPLYRVLPSDECWSDEIESNPDEILDTSSSNLSR